MFEPNLRKGCYLCLHKAEGGKCWTLGCVSKGKGGEWPGGAQPGGSAQEWEAEVWQG